jgi:hypothetical protein
MVAGPLNNLLLVNAREARFPEPLLITILNDRLLSYLRSISTAERYSHDRKSYFLPYEA